MKRTIFALATVMALMSCGGSQEESIAQDSTFIADSILAQDTAAVVEVEADTVVNGDDAQRVAEEAK